MIYPSSSDKRSLFCGACIYRLIKAEWPHKKTLLHECSRYYNLEKIDDVTLRSLIKTANRRMRMADTMGCLLAHLHALARAGRFPSVMLVLECISGICYTAKHKRKVKGLACDIETLRKRWLEFEASIPLCYAFSARKQLMVAQSVAVLKGPGIDNPVNVAKWWAKHPHTFMAEAVKVEEVVIAEIREAMEKHSENTPWNPRLLNSVFYSNPKDRPLPDIDARIILLDSDTLDILLKTSPPPRNE